MGVIEGFLQESQEKLYGEFMVRGSLNPKPESGLFQMVTIPWGGGGGGGGCAERGVRMHTMESNGSHGNPTRTTHLHHSLDSDCF